MINNNVGNPYPFLINNNWPLLKKTSQTWSEELYITTQKVLQTAAAEFHHLASFNELGVYHKMPRNYGIQLMKDYDQLKTAPEKWIGQGNFPGIWCALFDPCNTYSVASDASLYILRLTFKAEYRIFDYNNPEHMSMWTAWKETLGNMEKNNSWVSANNELGMSLYERAKLGPNFCFLFPSLPEHVEFYREHKFGAVVGYSDYMALTVVLSECIDSLEVASALQT